MKKGNQMNSEFFYKIYGLSAVVFELTRYQTNGTEVRVLNKSLHTDTVGVNEVNKCVLARVERDSNRGSHTLSNGEVA